MKKIKKNRGIAELKSRYGMMFVLPWTIGILLFFIIPLLQSVWYSFTEMTVQAGGVRTIFIGLDNYREILISDPYYTKLLKQAVIQFLYSLPIILLLSLVLALLLNQRFIGRTFFRGLYFLPVIIASGTVITLLFTTTSSDLNGIGSSEAYTSNMFSVEDIVNYLQIDGKIAEYITSTISRIFDLVWSCGIQIVLFLAGLQSVPASLYEASKVEGATKWEEFWFITFPMLSRVTLLVAIFTMVELITNERTRLVSNVYSSMRSGIYDTSSAMVWFYFLVSGAIMGLLVLLYNRLIMKHYEA